MTTDGDLTVSELRAVLLTAVHIPAGGINWGSENQKSPDSFLQAVPEPCIKRTCFHSNII
jgi:hypothetical protein